MIGAQDILVFLCNRCSLNAADWPMVDLFTKTRMNRLINKTYFRLWLFKNKGTHGKYNLKIHIRKYNTWYMKSIWKLYCEFADGKVNWFTDLRDSTNHLHVCVFGFFGLLRLLIVKMQHMYFSPYFCLFPLSFIIVLLQMH